MIADNLKMNDLFMQLGLPNDDESIDDFIEKNRGLAAQIKLEDAPFWDQAQASFIETSILEDAEWAELIDQLSNQLR
ncbi:MAG: DUF2789 domain-containing protein [Aliiglaciecola sp.]|uniref:DUF2789 family protein n=1 Tax=Aliiglaciecola sp. M165 TaxID=2593649 RepID=UPI00117F8E62|nr:DUF2789 family protein [Aliiglaciecola sp. M165]TRY30792.1 DUF2789 domain-containing protein [Aliiglaciecola sp. M165]